MACDLAAIDIELQIVETRHLLDSEIDQAFHLSHLPSDLIRFHTQRLQVIAEQFNGDLGSDPRHQLIDAHGDRLR